MRMLKWLAVMANPLRVLVVDDTAIYRKIVSDILRELPGVEVVGTAVDGKIALEKIRELKPPTATPPGRKIPPRR